MTALKNGIETLYVPVVNRIAESYNAAVAQNDSSLSGNSQFMTTHWSVVLAAGQQGTADAQAALAKLCEIYWYPLYSYIRRQNYGIQDAQDLTQEFFFRFLQKDYLNTVSPDKGRFRAYVLTALKHFLINERGKARAEKRGGDRVFIPLDLQAAERRLELVPSQERTPEMLFERDWTLVLLERVRARLKEDYWQKSDTFERLKDFLAGETSTDNYAAAASDLCISVGAVKMAVQRLRGRYRELLKEEIAQTVKAESEVADEIRYLFATLSAKH